MSSICSAMLCGFLIVILIVMLSSYLCVDGFRSSKEKNTIAQRLVKTGQPVYERFKSMGLDGVEYYDAKQLWRKNKYDVKNIREIL